MNWLQEWAKIEVIMTYIGLGVLALVIFITSIILLIKGIKYLYKSYSKKYEWDCVRGKYVKKEELL